jgi:hypothetical protein
MGCSHIVTAMRIPFQRRRSSFRHYPFEALLSVITALRLARLFVRGWRAG